MNDFLDQISGLPPQRLALLAVRLKEQLDKAHAENAAPIAVIGIACRLPGANDVDAFWDLLKAGREGIREVPPERWPIDDYFDSDPDAPGKMSARRAGFLETIDGFDPAFFGIAPREALTMDPQQRLLLEVAWEALENAGVSPASLNGSRTGVYVGICNSDYLQLLLRRGPSSIDAYQASGNAPSVASGRLSYVMGLQGPCMTIDTSCSASLAAIHAACQSLRQGESALALAGGVNVICAPDTSIAMSKSHMLAPDGRCKTFDATADGFVRGEGCGIIVLKRLSNAERDGDRILAVVRGSALNQDGRSSGLTAPNGSAQEAVIRDALASARLAAADIDYVEAHGTGTSLGDPIEVEALGRVFREGRDPDRPLQIGSVKTNIGHLEAAAGVAGFIKVVLALQHGAIPKHLNFTTPNPFIKWADLPIAVVDEELPWTAGARPRRAGVSSFGFSGTNAHIILEEAPAAATPEGAVDRPLHCLAISARTESALRELARRYGEALAPEKGLRLADVASVAGVGRAHLAHRLAIVAADRDEATSALQAASRGDSHPRVRRGSVRPGRSTDVAFLYTGAGAQYPGMGRALYDTAPAFRDAIDLCDRLLGADGKGRTLNSVLWSDAEAKPSIHEIGWTQPAMFAFEYALTTLWRSWGVAPAAVVGHSVGEYAAACAAGVFSLEDGLRLIAGRGRLMQEHSRNGLMAALFAPLEDIEAAVAPLSDRLAVAAVNGPQSAVISGEAAAVETVLTEFAKRNVVGQRLYVSLAAHSPLMDPALDRMEALARSVAMAPPSIPVAWNLTGGALPNGSAPDAVYWRRHMREPVRFADGVRGLYDDGFRIFLEVGPHPTLLALAQQSLPEEDSLFLSSMRRGRDDWNELLTSLADLHVHGVPVDFAGFDRPYARRRVALPTYPFERERFWAPAVPRPDRGPGEGVGQSTAEEAAKFNDLFHEIRWEPAQALRFAVPNERSRVASTAERWIVLSEGTELGRALATSLGEIGDRVEILEPAQWRTALTTPGALESQSWWRAEFESRTTPPANIVYLGALAIGPLTGAPPDVPSREAFRLLKAAARSQTGRVWLATRGAQDVRGLEDVRAPDQAGVWGLARTFGLERPAQWGGIVDLDPETGASDAAAVILAAIRDPEDDQSAWRDGTRLVPRLVRAKAPAPRSYALRSNVSYLIAGGLGGLGLAVAEWMAARGARHLVLVSRTAVPPPEQWGTLQGDRRVAALGRLQRAGVAVQTVAADVADEPAMTGVMARFGKDWPALGGVAHTAVKPTGAPLSDLPEEMFDAMFRTKVESYRLIERLSAEQPVTLFVDFSTTTAVLGSAGLAHYAAANAVLDALACRRRAGGKAALSVNWGMWDQVNVDREDRERILRGGLRPIATAVGLAALEALLADGATRKIVADADWAALRDAYESRRPQPILSRLAAGQGGPPPTETLDVSPSDLMLLPPNERRSTIDAIVRRDVSHVVGLRDPQLIDGAVSLFKMGLDSLMALQLQRRLERFVAESLPSAVIFNYPTVEALVDLLETRMAARRAGPDSPDVSADLLNRLDEMSGDQIDSLLSRMLSEGGVS